MAFQIADRVKETTTTTGTGTLDLGGAESGYQTFVAGIGNGNETYYSIEDLTGTDWEVGIGTVTDAAPDTLSRDTVLSSSNGGSLVNFGAGDKVVFSTQPASKTFILSSDNTAVISNINASTLTAGTVNDARLSANVTLNNASTISTGTLDQDRLANSSITINGTGVALGGSINVGDIEGVTAGDGLTGGGTTGAVTLNVGAGTGIDVTADAVAVDVSDFMTNGSNNRVLTATGTDAMNAEANMTFDGSVLSVTGNVNASSTFNGSGAGLTTLNASNVSSGTLDDARLTANVTLNNASTISTGTLADARLTSNVTLNNASTISTGTLPNARLSAIPNSALDNSAITINGTGVSLGGSINVGDITGVTAGSGLTGGGTSGTVTLNVGAGNLIDVAADTVSVDLSELTTSTSDADGDFFAVVDSANAQKKLTKGNINISGFNNDAGYTTNVGDITGVTAGNGLTGGGASGSVTLNVGAGSLIDVAADTVSVDLSELTDMTGTMVGTDEFVVLDASSQKRKAASEIGLSIFNNDSGFTTNVGDITGVTAGNGLTGGGASGSVTLNVGAGTGISVAADTVGLATAGPGAGTYGSTSDATKIDTITLDAYGRVTAVATGSTGDITGVTAGTNLTGGGTSGTVTLNMATGGVGSGTYGSTANGTKIDTITVDAYGRVTAVATGATGSGNGDITGVTAGNGLTGGGSSGSVTLNVGAGTGIDVAADSISVDVSDFMSNGSNNRVLTATGADGMNAESNLVFNGDLGVGETSPSRRLHVKDSDIITSLFESTNANFSRIKVANGGSDYSYFGSFSTDARIHGSSVVFEDGATERMRVTSSGGATRVGIATATPSSTLDVNGSLSKSSGSFKIDHPLENKKNTHHLVHSFVEAPQADNIYRGKINLVNGTATVNIDTVAGMSEGTFVLLNREIQCFTSNETGWTAVKGSVSGNILTITAQDNTCTDTISWMVIGERHDDHMYDTEWTDENGKVIVEPLK